MLLWLGNAGERRDANWVCFERSIVIKVALYYYGIDVETLFVLWNHFSRNIPAGARYYVFSDAAESDDLSKNFVSLFFFFFFDNTR